MAGHNPTLVKNYTAGAVVRARRIVQFGSADGTVIESTAAANGHLGVSTSVEAASGERCDVIRDGIADVVFGATVARGALVTSDAQGRAITASASAGTNIRIIGIAEESGVVGDIRPILISPGSFQG